MIDRLFLAALTFCLLAAGTLAMVSALVDTPSRRVAVQQVTPSNVVQLPAVEMTIIRSRPATTVAQNETTEPALRTQQ